MEKIVGMLMVAGVVVRIKRVVTAGNAAAGDVSVFPAVRMLNAGQWIPVILSNV
jgi:hypothetical protein